MRDSLKPALISLMFVLAGTTFYVPSASAHGEKSQAAFMRMRTIHWFDLNWSREKVQVNDFIAIAGKFHVFEGWPETVAEPDVAFLNIGIPGPVFIRKESYIGGQFVPRSVRLEIGKTYDFRVVLKARRPGGWHVHTMLNVQGGGPIIGPGKWITIEGSMSDFKNPITTLIGDTVDLEIYNEGNTYFWHFLWYATGMAWMLYWVRRPVFIPRLLLCDAGRAAELISPTDRKVGLAFAVGTIAVVVLATSIANSKYPITIPLQAGTMRGIKPLEMPEPTVAVRVEHARYRVPGRAMQMMLTVTNRGSHPIRLGEFYTASVRFLDSSVHRDTTGYPEDLLAEDGLEVSDSSPIAPRETRTVEVTASDAAWEVYRLSDIIYDPDSRFAGLLFFFDNEGARQIVQVDAPLIPCFTSTPCITPPPSAGPKETNFEVVSVFFATDRNYNPSAEPKEMFGVARSDLSYGICPVSIPREHIPGELESPSILRLEFREDQAKHVTMLRPVLLPKDQFFSELANRVRNSGSRSTFLFVHGFNVSFEDAARRTAQIFVDLAFQGAPVFYSWPSQGKLVINPIGRWLKEGMKPYQIDRENSVWARTNLKGFLDDFFTRSDAKSVYLIAHSMGNQALPYALKELLTEKPDLRINERLKEVILAAPDIDADIFKRDIAPALAAASGRPITLYASSNDFALKVSELIQGGLRAGDADPVLMKELSKQKGIEVIDASRVDTDFLGHSYFVNTYPLLSDMHNLIVDGKRPDARRFTLLPIEGQGRYWELKPYEQ